MIREEQFKLFTNDPKLSNISCKDKKATEIAIMKVYVGQKPLRRREVIIDTIDKKSNTSLEKP